MWPAIQRAISDATARPFAIDERRRVAGGSINEAYVVTGGGARYFIKVNQAAHGAMFDAEAQALAELTRAACLRVPQVVARGATPQACWLILEFLELSASGDERQLGTELAMLHGVSAARFGWQRDNTIGTTAQHNTWDESWPRFWRDRRLGFQLDLARRNGAPRALLQQGDRLLARIGRFFGDSPVVPALMHGDLWAGNAAYLTDGTPVVYDPASYYGHHEADIAMTELFGGFGADFYAAYRATRPLADGYGVRKDLYNLYHVLNHYNLFRGGYATQAARMIERLLAEV